MFSTAVYDRFGHHIAWKKGRYIFDVKGRQLPLFIYNECLFTFLGQCLGYFSKGFFRDKTGRAVACTQSGTEGPLLPLFYPTIPTFLDIPEPESIKPMPLVVPINRWEWSKIAWEKLINPNSVLEAEKPPNQKKQVEQKRPLEQSKPSYQTKLSAEEDFGIIFPEA